MARQEPLQRFIGKVRLDPATRCLEWSGYRDRDGYPQFWDGEKMVLAHRWIFAQLVAPLADGEEMDHLCENRCCVNPCHLENVASLENKLRITDKGRRTVTYIERDVTALERVS